VVCQIWLDQQADIWLGAVDRQRRHVFLLEIVSGGQLISALDKAVFDQWHAWMCDHSD